MIVKGHVGQTRRKTETSFEENTARFRLDRCEKSSMAQNISSTSYTIRVGNLEFIKCIPYCLHFANFIC